MSETGDAFGPLLRQLQVEMRSIRDDLVATRALIEARASETQSLIENRFSMVDTLPSQRLAQTERRVGGRLAHIETLLTPGQP